jgi:hypothetical protein
MGVLNRLFSKGNTPPEKDKRVNHLAFVLLSEARVPGAQEIAHALRDFAALDENLQAEADETEEDADNQVILSLRVRCSGVYAGTALCLHASRLRPG